MLSLPLIPPRADASLWPSHRLSNPSFDNPTTDSHNSSPTNRHRRPTSHHGQNTASSRSMLAALAADENVIYQRKQNVRRFGAGWIRPPGVAKTYQATMDEDLERKEQEALARREQVLLDLAAAQTEAANQEAAAQGEDDEMMEDMRDLDDEIPEAEADQSDVSAEEDEEQEEEEDDEEEASELEEGDATGIDGRTGDMTFNEDSFIEGSVAADVEHMLEMEEAEIAGVLQEERDLDDDIPEAGSYEHTDSELVDSSSDEGVSALGLSSSRRNSGRRRSSGARSGRVNRSSIGLEGSSSILEGSSFLRSSPVAARGSLRSRFMGSRTQRGG